MGWFYPRWVARSVVAAAAAASGAALLLNPFLGIATIWLNLVLASVFCLECAAYLHIRLERQARTDPLTGALNRTGLTDRATQELARAARTSTPLTVAVLDLDDFKAVNDTRGHAAGDRLLVDVVEGLRQEMRPYDGIARLGGDEFMVLMPGLTPGHAEGVLARLRAGTGDVFSCGVATSRSSDTVATLTERADRRLYRDKRARKERAGDAG
nr:GGDEF domain-containing protein [Nakamurella flavida]